MTERTAPAPTNPLENHSSSDYSGGICPTWVKVSRLCGGVDYVQATCSDPFCLVCQKLKVNRAVERWRPEVETWVKPKFMTLTMKSSPSLEYQAEAMMASFRRFFHRSLGVRNWPKLRRQTLAYTIERCEANGQSEDERLKKVTRSLNRLEKKIQVLQAHKKNIRFRDLIDRGVRTWEVSLSDEGAWHFHLHILAEMAFIPQELLVVMWRWATRGEGWIVDIRSAYSRFGKNTAEDAAHEALKYAIKPGDVARLTDEQRQEARDVLRGRKRIWAIGDVSFKSEESVVCPHCGSHKRRPKKQPVGDDKNLYCFHTDIEFGYTKWSNYGNDESIEEIGDVLYQVKFHKSGAEDVLIQRDGRWSPVYSIPSAIALQPDSSFDLPRPEIPPPQTEIEDLSLKFPDW